jgi:hypothetical protein
MNAAARSGGVPGVRQYMATGHALGGVMRFAGGGIVLNGQQPFSSIPQRLDSSITDSLVHRMIPLIVAKIQALIAAAAAAAARALGAIGGAIGGAITGGGGARAWIIAHESGGNPRAKNPTSTASGLYQFINGTWKAYGGSTATAAQASVAEQNAVADRYVASRYGSWENAQRFWMAHHWYDGGGYLQPGMTMAMNNTGTSERVLSPSETRAYDRAPVRGGDGGALLAAVQGLRGELRALRGDVDHHGDQAGIAARLDVTNRLLASSGRSAGAAMQSDRRDSELGAWA